MSTSTDTGDPELLQLEPGQQTPGKARAKDGSWRGFSQGIWPETPPFQVSRRASAHYYLIGMVSAPEYHEAHRVMRVPSGGAFPWTEYLARRWGPGYYEVRSQGSGRSLFLVPDHLAHLWAGETKTANNPPEPPPQQDPIESLLGSIEQLDRLREALADPNPPPPPPPPKPGPADQLMAMLPQLIAQMMQQQQQQQQRTPPPASPPSVWDQLGRIYESQGITADMMIAQLQQELTAKQAELEGETGDE